MGMKKTHRVKMTPATIRELAAAMKALGAYDGENTEAEHEKEAQRLGVGKDYYRMRLANALLGIAEGEVMLSEVSSPSTELMLHAHHRFPLRLRNRILPQIKWLADGDTVRGLFVIERVCIRVRGAHQERPRGNQHKLHADAVGK
jgi:hypothetical protein